MLYENVSSVAKYYMTNDKTLQAKKRSVNTSSRRPQPISFSLVKSLAKMREACFKENGENVSSYKHNLAAKDLVVLGRLINAWRDIVGLELATKTCPVRLFRGTLYLTVSDSQWMQNLLFMKADIVNKLSKSFSDVKVTNIVGRVGKIPTEVSKLVREAAWPDWREEKVTEKTGIKDPELAKAIDVCQQKLNARFKGLEDRGYRLCNICRANMTRSKDGICALCLFEHGKDVRMKSRSALAEEPWLTYEEVKSKQKELTSIEYESIKSELLSESMNLVNELASDLKSDFDDDTYERMRCEMVRAIVLYANVTPDKVDFDNLEPSFVPDKKWFKYLKYPC